MKKIGWLEIEDSLDDDNELNLCLVHPAGENDFYLDEEEIHKMIDHLQGILDK